VCHINKKNKANVHETRIAIKDISVYPQNSAEVLPSETKDGWCTVLLPGFSRVQTTISSD